ncbi:MAG: hypothetical protein AAGC55_00330 [Myxococcota bacterium]
MTTLHLHEISRSRHQLALSFAFGDLRFATTVWYGDADLLELEQTHGRESMDRIYFHIAAAEMMAVISLRPDRVDFGEYSRYVTDRFAALWTTLFDKIWAQWRYENDLPDYRGPALSASTDSDGAKANPLAIPPGQPGAPDVLCFCGGGKDSLAAMALLESGDIPYDAYVYTHTVYGAHPPQRAIIAQLLERCAPRAVRKTWVQDELLSAPVLELYPELGITTLCAAETPCSIFAALPVALARGYRYLVLAHERSADTGQMVWDKTGEDINHQWGKSLDAEVLLNGYVNDELVSGLGYFSLLKPIYDVLICNLLAEHLDAVPATHSCNIAKPWCQRCPKCAYVWLHYMAWLPHDVVTPMFSENLFDLDENQLTYRQLLGLEDRLPFECIGQVGEVRLAFEVCRRRGVRGRAMDIFLAEVGPISGSDFTALVDHYLTIAPEQGALPGRFAEVILPQLAAIAERTRERLLAT